MPTLQQFFDNCFPQALSRYNEFEDYYEDIRQLVYPAVTDTIDVLRRKLVQLEGQLTDDEGGRKRDHWRLFGEEDPIKSADSAFSKLARNMKDAGIKAVPANRLSAEALQDRILSFSDLGRCRIVCTFNQDIEWLVVNLPVDVSRPFLGSFGLNGEVKDFIYDPNRRDGLRGHRAYQFSVRVPIPGSQTFLFEIQMMTELQHAWDRRNHPLYEWTREGKELSRQLRVNDFACAESLHVVDQQADRNWVEFLRGAREANE